MFQLNRLIFCFREVLRILESICLQFKFPKVHKVPKMKMSELFVIKQTKSVILCPSMATLFEEFTLLPLSYYRTDCKSIYQYWLKANIYRPQFQIWSVVFKKWKMLLHFLPSFHYNFFFAQGLLKHPLISKQNKTFSVIFIPLISNLITW